MQETCDGALVRARPQDQRHSGLIGWRPTEPFILEAVIRGVVAQVTGSKTGAKSASTCIAAANVHRKRYRRRRGEILTPERLTLIAQPEYGLYSPPCPPLPHHPPTPENEHLYSAAAIAYRQAWRDELQRNDGNHKLANPHVPLDAAALAVQQLAPEMAFEEAGAFAQKACAWAAQNFNSWFWS